ncbi:MAG: TRAP transporter substrate-binding protein [Desulfovermiculus sp.]
MRQIFCLTTFVFAVLSLFTFFSFQSEAQATSMSYSSFFPSTHIQAKTAEAWCEEVEKRTDGRVTINFYPGQTLTKANQTYESVVDGICDIGTSCLAYTPGRFPVMSAVDLPFGYPSGEAATEVANTLYETVKPEEFSGTKVMYFNAHGPGFIHTRKDAVESLDDMKGLKIRSTGMSADVLKALDASPVTMAMPDAYQSLQKGVVDGSIHPVETNKGWNIGEVVDYMTKSYATGYTTTFFVVMNKDKWNSLDSKDQEIIKEINQEWAARHAEAWDTSDEEGMEFFKDQGGEVVTLDDEEDKKWQEAVAPVIEDYKQDLDDKGLNGQEVISTIEDALKQYKQ